MRGSVNGMFPRQSCALIRTSLPAYSHKLERQSETVFEYSNIRHRHRRHLYIYMY